MGKITNIPDKIYLQVDPDEWITDAEQEVDISDLNHEITWCEDNVNSSDIEYLKITPERLHAEQLYQASKNLLHRCLLADADGDLSDWIDGIYLEEMQAVHSNIENPKEK